MRAVPKQPKRVLVTGGGGFLGGAIVRQLVERGNHVFSFSRGEYPQLSALGVQQIQGDIGCSMDVLDAISDMDVVFHTAAKAGVWGDYKDYHRTNYMGTLNVIFACRSSNVRELVYTSSPSVVFDSVDMEGVDESVPYPSTFATPYQKTKAAAEKAVIAAAGDDRRTIVLRPHLIWGPGDPHLVSRIMARAKQLKIVGKGTNRVDTIYVDNAAKAHLLAADRLAEHPELSGRCYFISQGEPVNLWQMINDILAAGGKKPVTKKISHGMARKAGALMEFVFGMLNMAEEPKMTRFVADELAKSHWFDISAARRDLGYDPEVSTQEGLKRLAEWLGKSRY